MKILVGLINNELNKSSFICTRFMLVNLKEQSIEDVTSKVVEGVNKAKIATFKYRNGVAIYDNTFGLSSLLSEDKFKEISTVDLEDCKLEMYTLSDIRNIFGCKNVFDYNMSDNLLEYVLERVFDRAYEKMKADENKKLIIMRKANIETYERILDGSIKLYHELFQSNEFIENIKKSLKIETMLLKNLYETK